MLNLQRLTTPLYDRRSSILQFILPSLIGILANLGTDLALRTSQSIVLSHNNTLLALPQAFQISGFFLLFFSLLAFICSKENRCYKSLYAFQAATACSLFLIALFSQHIFTFSPQLSIYILALLSALNITLQVIYWHFIDTTNPFSTSISTLAFLAFSLWIGRFLSSIILYLSWWTTEQNYLISAYSLSFSAIVTFIAYNNLESIPKKIEHSKKSDKNRLKKIISNKNIIYIFTYFMVIKSIDIILQYDCLSQLQSLYSPLQTTLSTIQTKLPITTILGKCHIAEILISCSLCSFLTRYISDEKKEISIFLFMIPIAVFLALILWPLTTEFLPIIAFCTKEIITISQVLLILVTLFSFDRTSRVYFRSLTGGIVTAVTMILSPIIISESFYQNLLTTAALVFSSIFIAFYLLKKDFCFYQENNKENIAPSKQAKKNLLINLQSPDRQIQQAACRLILYHLSTSSCPLFLKDFLQSLGSTSFICKKMTLDHLFNRKMIDHPEVAATLEQWRKNAPTENEKGMISLFSFQSKHPLPAIEGNNPFSLSYQALLKEKSQTYLLTLLKSKEMKGVEAAIIAIGIQKKPSFIPTLLSYLVSQPKNISIEAAQAIYRSAQPLSEITGRAKMMCWKQYGIPICNTIQKITNPKVQKYLIQSLKCICSSISVFLLLEISHAIAKSQMGLFKQLLIQIGPSGIPSLLHFSLQKEKYKSSRLLACEIIYKISPLLFKKYQSKILQEEQKNFLFCKINSCHLVTSYPEYKLESITTAFEKQMRQSKTFTTKLLYIGKNIADIEYLLVALQSPIDAIYQEASTMLQWNYPPHIATTFLSLVEKDSAPYIEKQSPISTPYTLNEIIDFLDQQHSRINGMLATRFKKRFFFKNWKASLYKQICDDHPGVQHFTKEIMQQTQ